MYCSFITNDIDITVLCLFLEDAEGLMLGFTLANMGSLVASLAGLVPTQ